ncbi:unnamed protein product, partial [Mesorhabditis belari]|uniref:Uncharacterized protein n=1 Tax=Mesorhabditis belari TaxID=2138241 RepID=A0AAF3FPV8_9BILA
MELIEALFIFQTIVDITAICVHAWIFALCFKKGLYIAKQYIYASCVTSTLILFLNGIFNRVRVYAITAPWLLWMYRLVADAKVALVEYVIFHYLVKSAVTAAFANAIVKCFAQKYRKKMAGFWND